MADNTRGGSTDGASPLIATDEVTYSGDTADVQLFRPVHVTGSEGAKTVDDMTTSNGLKLDPTYFQVSGTGADALANTVMGLDDGSATTPLGTMPHVFNGTTWDRLRGNTGGVFVNGQVAHDVADTGNPIKIGGFGSAGLFPTLATEGDRVRALFDLYGHQSVAISQIATGADAQLNTNLGAPISFGEDTLDVFAMGTAPHVFNGTTWDRLPGDTFGLFVQITGTSGDVPVSFSSNVQTVGDSAHDAADSASNPVKIGGYASATAPANVTAADRVNAWFLLNGSQATTLTAAGALIGGDATNGLDVDVTRLPALVAGSANIGDVDIASLPDEGQQTMANSISVAIASNQSSVAVTATATDLDIRNLVSATDAVTAVGPAADGAAVSGNPVRIAGKDGSGNTQDIATDTSGELQVDVLTLPGVGGLAAHASPTSGNPVYMAGRASTVIPTDVGADGDAAGMWTNRSGAQMVSTAPHVGLNSDPWNLVHEGAQYTSAQTSTVLVAGGASEKIVVTKVQIQAYATTAGTAILYFGTGAFARGTNRAVFDGEFAPSATNKPGVVMDGPFIAGTNGDDLMVTTTNALSITFSVWYYVVT